MSVTNRAVREANRAVNEAVRDAYVNREFKIVRFGRHREGYLHAQVALGGKPVYVFQRYGSWQIPREPQSPECPVTFPGKVALRDVLAPFTYRLSEEARRFTDAERRHMEEQDADGRKAAGGTVPAQGSGAAAEAA